jgi:hypothetical protein
MTLHRDIYWVGRQWAVTGYGLQACDQKQKGQFDIEAARLWDDGLVETMHAKEWLNAADFDKGLEIARERYREQPGDGAEPPKQEVLREDPLEEEPLKEVPLKEELPKAIVSPAQLGPQVTPPLVAGGLEESKPQSPTPLDLQQRLAEIKAAMRVSRDVVEPSKPELKFDIRIIGSAKFVRPWRVRHKQ